MKSYTKTLKGLILLLQKSHMEIESQPVLAIHDFRKHTKFLRALLQLIPGSASQLKKTLKHSGRTLAPYRDAQVNLETWQSLNDSRSAIYNQEIDATVTQHPYILNPRPSTSDLNSINQHMVTLNQYDLWDTLDLQKTVLSRRIEKSFHTGLTAMEKILDNPEPELLHKWRKRTKRLWYQLRFACGDDHAQEDHPVIVCDQLGKHLGEIHDLDMFSQLNYVKSDQRLLQAVAQKRIDLVKQAGRLGQHLYIQSSDHLHMLLSQLS